MCSSGLIHRHPLSCSRCPTSTVRSSSLAFLLFHFLPLSLDSPIRTLSQAPPTTTLHDHGIRPNAAPVSTLIHPNAGGSVNRRSYRRKDGGVTRDSSRSLVVPRQVPLLYYWDDYLAAGALISRECLNIVSSLMSSASSPGIFSRGASRRPQHSSLLLAYWPNGRCLPEKLSPRYFLFLS